LPVWYVIGAIVAFFIVFETFPQVRYLVHRNVPGSELASHVIRPWLLPGCNGYSVMIYHRPSDIVIRASKSLHPNFDRCGTVNLTVTRMHILNPRKGRLDNRPPLSIRLGRRYMAKARPSAMVRAWRDFTSVWVWDLPSPEKGHVLEKVDCGNSLGKVTETVQRMIEENEPLRDNPVFDVWGKGRFTRHTMGLFEDERGHE